MKLLKRVYSLSEFIDLANLLHEKGIPCYSVTEGGTRTLYCVAIYVCIDSQYDDAFALMADPEHAVREVIDASVFLEAKSNFDYGLMIRYSLAVLVVVATALAVVVWWAVPSG